MVFSVCKLSCIGNSVVFVNCTGNSMVFVNYCTGNSMVFADCTDYIYNITCTLFYSTLTQFSWQ